MAIDKMALGTNVSSLGKKVPVPIFPLPYQFLSHSSMERPISAMKSEVCLRS